MNTGLLFAAVLVMACGFAMVIGYIWGSLSAAHYVLDNIETIVAEELLEDMLEDPNSSEATTTALKNLMKPRNPLTGGLRVENKKFVVDANT